MSRKRKWTTLPKAPLSGTSRPQNPFETALNEFDEFMDALDGRSTLLVSDVCSQIKLICKQSPLDVLGISFAFKHQLHAYISSFSHVERVVQELQEHDLIRLIRVPALGEEQRLIIFLDDMKERVNQRAQILNDSFPQSGIVLHEFFRKLVHSRKGDIIPGSSVSKLCPHIPIDETERILVASGFLVSDTTEAIYRLSLPGLGSLVEKVTNFRGKVIRYLEKAPNREMLESTLRKKRLRNNIFSWDFIISDLCGTSTITSSKTASGPLIRLCK